MGQPSERASRRRFVKLGATAIGIAAADRSGLAALRHEDEQPIHQAPPFDGELLTDAASREPAATDYGGFVHHLPRAVMRTVVTRSPARDAELFQMTLAGLGQCGILVRARLRLAPAPASITVQSMRYEDLTALLEDLRRLAADESLATIAGEITRGADGGWRRSVLVGTTAPASSDARASWKAGLRLAAADAPTTSSYWEYLDRRTASVAAGRSRGEANPSLAVAVPFDAAAALLTHVLSDPPAAQGIWRIEVLPLVTARFTQPLFKVPDGRFAFTLRFQRRRANDDVAGGAAMLAANQELVRRAVAAGGK